MTSTMSLRSMPMMGGSFGMDDFAMYMLGLLPEPGNRANVSVINTNSGTVTGFVDVLDSDGSAPSGTGVTSLPFQIAGYSSHQFRGCSRTSTRASAPETRACRFAFG